MEKHNLRLSEEFEEVRVGKVVSDPDIEADIPSVQ
jgi:hypothetical protein